EEEVPERVAAQPLAFGEPKAKQLGDERLVVGERDQTVANVARRKHAELAAQPSGRAAVVAHGDDGREVRRDLLEPAQHGREPGAAADDDDAITAAEPAAANRFERVGTLRRDGAED